MPAQANCQDLIILVCAWDLVQDKNYNALNAVLDASPDATVPVVWLSSILQCLNADLSQRLFPAKCQRELTAITIDQAAKISAAQSYLRKLARNSTNARNERLQNLKMKCQSIRIIPSCDIQYPRDMDADSEPDDQKSDLGEKDDGLAAEDNVVHTVYDGLVDKMPDVLKDMAQDERDIVLNEFCEALANEDVRTKLSEHARAMLALQEKFKLKSIQAQAIYEFIDGAAAVAAMEAVIPIDDTDDEDAGESCNCTAPQI